MGKKKIIIIKPTISNMTPNHYNCANCLQTPRQCHVCQYVTVVEKHARFLAYEVEGIDLKVDLRILGSC